MSDIDKWCQMCGAAPGEPCTVVSGGEGLKPGAIRPDVHWVRGSDEKPTVLVPDEPPFYVGDPKPEGGVYTREDALAWAKEHRCSREA